MLAVTRLFQKPHPRYTLRSLPALVAYVLKHADDLPVREPLILRKALAQITPIAGFEGLDDMSATAVAMAALGNAMPTPERNAALDALKQLRDKRLAHPEHVVAESIPRTTWGPAEELLKIAGLMVGVLGAYTSTIYLDADAEYIMSIKNGRG